MHQRKGDGHSPPPAEPERVYEISHIDPMRTVYVQRSENEKK